MSDILTNLNYDDHIEDKAAVLVDIAETAKWKQVDKKALVTIRLQVANTLLVYIAGSMTALAVWSMLSNMFETKSPIGIVSVCRKLFGTHCTEESDIEDHIRIMWTYQQELATLQKPISEEDFSYALLTSLPESWNNFISAVPEDVIKNHWLSLTSQLPNVIPVVTLGIFASDHGKQVNREKEEKEKQNNDKKEKKKKEEKGKNRQKKEKILEQILLKMIQMSVMMKTLCFWSGI